MPEIISCLLAIAPGASLHGDLVTLSPCHLVTLSSALSPCHLVTLSSASAATSAFGETIIKVLAIVGGAVVGGLVIGMLAQVLIKSTTHKPAPRFVKNLVRLLGAVAVGVAVYLFVFGPGGGGLGGFGWGLGGSDTTGHGGTNHTGPAGSPRERPTTTTATQVDRNQLLTIEMLGGASVKEDRFYQIEGEKQPANLDEVRKALEQRLRAQPPLKAIDIVIRPESVSERDPAVAKLRQLAEQLGLKASVTPVGEKP
jgi:hypothetical protein